MSEFLPHQGLPLLSDDGRVRWTSRLLAMVAIFMAWNPGRTLLDRFNQARQTIVGIYSTRKRPGKSHEGFSKALIQHSGSILAMLTDDWRRRLRQLAGACWTVRGWELFGVDGSNFECPRTAANEQAFGVTGKNNSGPQQLLTCLFHVGSGVLWGWVRGGIKGSSERDQLRQMLALLPRGAMLVADAGFSGYELLRSLLDRGNHVLIRVGANMTLLTHLGYAYREHKQTVYLWPLDKQGRQKGKMPRGLKNVKPPLVLRLIRLKDAKGRPICLLTNVLEKSQLSDRTAARIYRLRWGIEVMWRSLKQTMGHHKVLSGTPLRAGVELDWAMAGLWMMQLLSVRRMMQSRRSPHSYSPASSLRVLQQAMSGRRQNRRSLKTELANAVMDGYCRRGSKAARHYPHQRRRRPPGEPMARMACDQEKRLAQRILAQPPPEPLAA
ncbi:MAG TPA: IS4 family transposase [Candidatus Acidoferrales bacterium]|jgi:hypothetical protein|nr:IS4 family transposase [Candidatus Acidoferrales bacterium]